jgi:hypothetical protein
VARAIHCADRGPPGGSAAFLDGVVAEYLELLGAQPAEVARVQDNSGGEADGGVTTSAKAEAGPLKRKRFPKVRLQEAFKSSRGKKRRIKLTVAGVRSKDQWAKPGERRIMYFRMGLDDVGFLAVVTNVETATTTYPNNYQETHISEVTVKYVDPSKGDPSAVCLMEHRTEGQILGGPNATQTTFTDKKEFEANSTGGDLLFAKLFKKRRDEKSVGGGENAVVRQKEVQRKTKKKTGNTFAGARAAQRKSAGKKKKEEEEEEHLRPMRTVIADSAFLRTVKSMVERKGFAHVLRAVHLVAVEVERESKEGKELESDDGSSTTDTDDDSE